MVQFGTALLAAKSASLTLGDLTSIIRAEQEDDQMDRLIARLEPGDEQLAHRLYERYVDRVYAYLRLTLGDATDAEQVTHEVFIRALEDLPDYEQGDLPFRAWLFQIARHAAISRMRRNRRLIVEGPKRLAGPETERGEVLGQVEALPRAEQQVIVLRYLFELQWSQIADLLERSPDTARQLHHRAIQSLRGGTSS